MIKTYYNLSVYFIYTDREKTLEDKYIELTYKYDIITEYFVTNTPEQNDVIERSKRVIIRKTYCLRIIVNLSVSL